MDRFFHMAYGIACLVILFSRALHMQSLDFLAKPLLMPLLFLYFHFSFIYRSRSQTYLLLSLSLLFSWLGDVFLMFSGTQWFMAGLLSFLLAHVFYIIQFSRLKYQNGAAKLSTWLISRMILISVACLTLYIWLYDAMGDLQIPVAIYVLAIGTMAITALMRKGKTGENSFFLIYSGALLFIISDAMIAIGRFYGGFLYAGFLIMLTYMLAQYLIVRGIMAHQKQVSNPVTAS
ncbi:MAG: lysoplasmalogenase [Cyclobacteriaceae bacterium]|nr:lysoplasmalogenase [Cyclobacteriaceae bacterium]